MGGRGAVVVVVVVLGALIGIARSPALAQTNGDNGQNDSTTTAAPTTATTQGPPSTTTTMSPTTTSVAPATTAPPDTTTAAPPTNVERPATSTPAPTDRVTTPPVADSVPAAGDGLVPHPARYAPTVGIEVAPDVGAATDPVASLAEFTYVAFTPWRAALEHRAETTAAVAELQARPDATPEAIAEAQAQQTGAQAALTSLAPGYRFARDALADAVVARAGRPVTDAVALSAVWERADPKRIAVVLTALMQVGDRYVFAAGGPDRFDCSGLTRYAWLTAGVDLVHYAVAQRQQSLNATAAALLPGDLVFRFRSPGGHVMLYLGADDLVVQAGGNASGVAVTPWGGFDAFGSPLAPSDVPAAAADPTPLFGAGATSHLVAADVPFADSFNAAGIRYGVAPSLLAAIASVGTGFRADASTAAPSAGGLMQLRPAIAAELHVDAMVPAQAVEGAARRLADLWDRLHDETAVLAVYRTALRVVTSPAWAPADATTQAYIAAVTAAGQR